MRKTYFATVLTAASLLLGSVAFAQNNQHGRGGDDYPRNGPQQGQHDARRMQDDNRRGPPEWMQPAHRNGPEVAHDRGAGPDHNFRRGGRLPPEFRNRQYVVDNWRDHHLSAPPRGYHWVQTGGDYVLIAITTGIIAQVLLGNY